MSDKEAIGALAAALLEFDKGVFEEMDAYKNDLAAIDQEYDDLVGAAKAARRLNIRRVARHHDERMAELCATYRAVLVAHIA